METLSTVSTMSSAANNGVDLENANGIATRATSVASRHDVQQSPVEVRPRGRERNRGRREFKAWHIQMMDLGNTVSYCIYYKEQVSELGCFINLGKLSISRALFPSGMDNDCNGILCCLGNTN